MSLAALQDLFARVRAGATGVWTLGTDPHRVIFLERGQVVFAQSTHPLDRLTHLLVEKGKLTQAQMDYAMDNLAPGLSIGRNLIQMGFITQRDLLDIARFQVERVVWGALGTEGQDARFEGRDLDASVVRLALDTPALLLGGLLNLRDRERLLELLGPLEQALILQTPPPEPSLPPDLARVPSLIDGRRTLLDLAREAGTEPMRLGALALFLREMGWARPAELPAVQGIRAGGSEPSPEPPLGMEEPPLLVVVAPAAPEPPPGWTETQPVPAQPVLGEPAASPAPAPGDRKPSLIEQIQAAQQPTTNLDGMAESLDRLMAPEPPPAPAPLAPPVPNPWSRKRARALSPDGDEITAENPFPQDLPETHDVAGWHVEEGQALLPEPVDPPGPPAAEDASAEAPPRLEPLDRQPEPFPVVPPAAGPEGAPDFQPRLRRRKRKTSPLLLILPFVAVLGLAVWAFHSSPQEPLPVPVPPPAEPKVEIPGIQPAPSLKEGSEPKPKPEPKQPTPEPKPAAPEPQAPEPKTPAPEPKAPAPVPKAPAPEPKPAPTPADQRWATLRAGKVEQALAQGRAHLQGLKGNRWTLRLEIACQAETLQNAALWMEPRSKDLFILPITLRSGQTCNQLFTGSFASRAEAEAEIPKLPAPFRQAGNKPRAFPVAEIPSRQ